jgi:DNA-binding CsgD family transcriptional regulator
MLVEKSKPSNSELQKLTGGQRDCLKLVAQNYSSKEIARQLGVSRFTVDQRLRIAIQRLGVTTRFEAARLISDDSLFLPSEPLVYQTSHIALDAGFLDKRVPDIRGLDSGSGAEGTELRDSHGYFHDEFGRLPRRTSWPNPFNTGESNELNLSQKALWVILIAIGSALAFGVFASGLEAIARLH